MTLVFLPKIKRGPALGLVTVWALALAPAFAQMDFPTLQPASTPSRAPTPAPQGIPKTTPATPVAMATAPPRSLLLARSTPPTMGTSPGGQPPREIPLVEKKFEELSGRDVSSEGRTALGIAPTKWKHAETDNFILHYRRATEAQKVAREVEYDLWFVATALGAKKEQYAKKSHVYIFEDEDEWKSFVKLTDAPSWSASFAHGDDLFLNVRSGQDGRFDSNTLAHETTHAVVSRLYHQRRWPVWMNEGFAEYMGGASVAARKGQTVKRFQASLSMAELPLDTLEKMRDYPADETAVQQLYQTSEKLIRFLMNELPKDRISKFIDATLAGHPLKTAVIEVYGDKLKDWDEFQRKYQRFSK